MYLSADNNLDPYGLDDINEMEVAGSTDNVEIIALFDRLGSGDTVLYRIEQDPNGYHPTIVSTVLDDQGAIIPPSNEVDMGDPSTLANFATWTQTNYPSDQYLLILWDHGSGWDKTRDVPVKWVCHDDSSGNHLDLQDLSTALGAITNNGANKLDIIGFDACLMAMVEVDYQIAPYGDYRIASENTEPAQGWNYDDTLNVLVGTPSMSPVNLGAQFVSDYINECNGTLSTVNLALVNDLRAAVSDLGKQLAGGAV